MSDIEITVYIPNYNYDKYLDDSIKSVLDQSFKNWKLIIERKRSYYKTIYDYILIFLINKFIIT